MMSFELALTRKCLNCYLPRYAPYWYDLIFLILAPVKREAKHRGKLAKADAVNIYVFTSNSLTNIWAGIGARKWAVAESQAAMPGCRTKAAGLRLGSLGLLYCSEIQTVTTPFVVTSRPDTGATIANIWADTWHFPFGITPLGSPVKTVHKDTLSAELPSCVSGGRQWNHVISVQPQFFFQASSLTDDDWEYLYARLRHD
jgi:hypothetical protein